MYIMADFTREGNPLPTRFCIDIELRNRAEHRWALHFLAALNRVRDMQGPTQLETAFLSWSKRMRKAGAA